MENELTLTFIHNFEYDKDRFLAKVYHLENEIELFFLCNASEIQDGFRFRATSRALFLAQFLVDEKGQIKKEKITEIIHALEKEGEILYPGGYNDWEIEKHFLKILHLLLDEKFLKLITRFGLPLCHTKAESIVRESLGLESTIILTDAHVRICVLSALLCPLRQNVGSCFVTAPAILIHEEQQERFLEDLYELLTTGKLTRTFGGVEFAVPMSPSSGNGDLKKNIFSFSSQDRILFSPGLLFALTKVGLIKADLALEEKLEKLRALAAAHLEGKRRLSIEELLKEIISNETTWKKACSYFKGFAEQLLLKTWEFTLASFVDVKTEFSRWNLYLSLGLHPEEKGGIGEIIYQHLSNKLEEKNQKIQEFQTEYEIAYDQLRATERLLKNASSEAEGRRLTAEHYSRYYHMQVCLEMRDKNQADAEHYSQFFSFLIQKYREKFPDYFQEIYDAEMEGVIWDGFYDDSPAGFRLLYKHGRSDPTLWSFIHNEDEYIKSLVDFFIAAELQIKFEIEWEEGKQEIGALTTAIVQYLRSDNFLKTALMRLAKAYPGFSKDSKPWAYISGGTMNTLLKTYFRREGNLSEESKWVESPMELLTFIIDVLKVAPLSDDRERRILITSPTHAFSLLPGQDFLHRAIEERGFTYTWVRDHLLLPGQEFYDKIWLNSQEQTFLIGKFFEAIPLNFHKTIPIFQKKASVREFRDHLLGELGGNSLYFATELDSTLYQMLPLTQGKDLQHHISQLLADPQMSDIKDENPVKIIGAIELRSRALAQLISFKGGVFEKEDAYLKIMRRAEAFGLAPPAPLIAADTNWSERESYFAFLVNPGTSELELWRVDRTANLGKPMHIWNRWLNGLSKAPWTIYFRPQEYSH